MSLKSDFVHLHNHTEYSMLDGMPSVIDYIHKCNQLNMDSIAITEHGNLRSAFEFSNTANKNEYGVIKPILGIEFYLSETDYRIKSVSESTKKHIRSIVKTEKEYKEVLKKYEIKNGINVRYHILVLVKNEQGINNLLKLNYLAWKNGYYYRPRIDIELLAKYKDGLIITSSCIGGKIPKMIINNADDYSSLHTHIKFMRKTFGDDFYFEIQPHNIDNQRVVNNCLIELSKEYNIKLVATNDCHYVDYKHFETHDVLLAIQSKKDLKASDRWRFEGNEFYVKTRQEMLNTFLKYHNDIPKKYIVAALDNTVQIAEKCNFHFKTDKTRGIFPSVVSITGKNMTPKEKIIQLVKDGYKNRNIQNRATLYAKKFNISYEKAKQLYDKRIKYELSTIFGLRFESYFLVIYDYIRWCKENNILVGAGRGSSGGSIVSYLLGITNIDSLYYGLLFERFLNKERIDYPDIDTDIQDDKRQNVIDYFKNKYGENCVANIATIGRMKGRQVILDIGRVYNVPLKDSYKANKHIVAKMKGDERVTNTVEDAFNTHDECIEYNKKYPYVLKHAKLLEGKARNIGIHAAGVIISSEPVFKYVPVEYAVDRKTKERKLITSFDYKGCQDVGLVKIDALGLKTLTSISITIDAIKKRHSINVDLDNIDYDDKKILSVFNSGNLCGIFQFDSANVKNILSSITVKSFEDLITINALNRPGPMRSGIVKNYIDRVTGKKKIKSIHPIYDEITNDTYGLIIFQEQIISIFNKLSGFTATQSDNLRSAMSKSLGEEALGKYRGEFIVGCSKNGLGREAAATLFKEIVYFGDYAFNKSHSALYSIIACWQAHLKTIDKSLYYLGLFCKADKDETKRLIRYATGEGVEILNSDLNYSDVNFSIHNGKLIAGLSNINGIGENIAEKLVLDRKKNGNYKSLYDIRKRMAGNRITKSTIKSLVYSGSLKSIYENTELLITNIRGVERYLLLWDAKNNKLDDRYNYLKSKLNIDQKKESFIISNYAPVITEKQKYEYYIDKLIKKGVNIVDSISTINYDSDKFVLLCCNVLDIKFNISKDTGKEKHVTLHLADKTGDIKANIDILHAKYFGDIANLKGKSVLIYARVFADAKMLFIDIVVRMENRDAADNKYLKYLIQGVKNHNTNVSNIISKNSGIYNIVGVIINLREHKTKNNKKMLFFDIEDKNARLSVISWPETYKEYASAFVFGNIIQFSVIKKKDGYYVNSENANIKTLGSIL